MKKMASAWLLVALATAGLGCSYFAPTELQKNWGEAYRDTRAATTANPAAGELNRETPEGLDPASAELMMDKHRQRESVVERERAAPSVINIGTGAR